MNKSMSKKRRPPLKPFTFRSVALVVIDSILMILLVLPSILMAIFRILFFTTKKSVKDKIILITGAGNGLGREIALQLSKQGAVIICVDIRREDNEETVRKIEENKGKGRAYFCDVSSPEQIKTLLNVVLDEFGKVDILINNAGLIYANGMMTGTEEEIRKVVQVNFLSNVWMIRSFLPDMIEKKEGHILCIASVAGIHSLAQANIYSCTKFALLGLVYSLIEELRIKNDLKKIKISCAMPYFINTNKIYSEQWNLRFPALTTEEAAKLVIEGMRREYKFYTVPWIAFGYSITSMIRILPKELYYFFRNKCYADFTLEQTMETKL